MDDKGFIFTTDATLALVVVIVLTTSIVSYQLVPAYMGQDHQHLEALADSVLMVMEQDGTLNNAAVEAARNNTTGAQQILNNRLTTLIPTDTGYKLTLNASNLVVATDNRGLTYSSDMVTKIRVISGPREGWMGRAWYKIEKFDFINQTQNVTTTVWNFHNWLTNFAPWTPGGYDRNRNYYTTNGLINNPYWGSGTTPQNIQFSFPSDANIYNAKFLIGSCNKYSGVSYNANTTINGNVYPAYTNQFTFLNYRPNTNNAQRMYNYQGFVNSGLVPGVNNFNVRFWNMTGPNNQRTERYDLAWYSIIGNYSTTFPVPNGILTSTYNFPDASGMAVQTAQDLGGGGGEYGRIYNLNTGSVTSLTNRRVIDWNSIYNKEHAYDDGLPFVITGTNGGNQPGCAVSIVQNVNIPAGYRIFDSFVVVNAYGGVDQALIEVNNGTSWRTIFNSQDYSARSDGYGNIPGIVYIPNGYLLPGQNNKVRITIWDDVPGNDYDLVGLTNCYVTATYSALNVNWVNHPYNNHQSNSNVETQTRNFDIDYNAKEVLLFVGVGTDSRTITVSYPGTPDKVLYSGNIPYYLNLASLDAAKGFHVITTANSTATKYYLKEGSNYPLKVTVNGPSYSWESGDWDRNAEIFSGTRISVLYPEFLRNVWADAYESTPQEAMRLARYDLADQLGLDRNDPAIKTEALYTGNLPNQVPVRLELWKH